MSQALYRKWRPQQWDQVVGQEHVVQTLRNAVRADRVAHAYLFAGPRGTGKTTTARLLAKAVNCLDPDLSVRPCDQCEHCLAVNQGRFLDLIEIDAASNTSVDDIRDLREKINFSPNQGRYKVYIIDEVHMLSTAAFNALLKTLEEPPSHAIFILATTEIHKIPATVLSRCQRHEFRRIPVADIVRHLKQMSAAEGLSVDEDALVLLARQATGSLRDAISLLDQLASSGGTIDLEMAQSVLGTVASQSVLDIVESIQAGEAAEGLDQIHLALDAGSDPRQFARQIVDYLRNLLLIHMENADQVDATAEVRAQMARHAQGFDLPALLGAIRSFTRAANDARSAWQPSLPLEIAFVESLEGGGSEDEAEAPKREPKQRKHRVSKKESDKKVETPSQDIPPMDEAAASAVSEAAAAEDAASESGITLKMVNERWRQILGLVGQESRQTLALLNSCRPYGFKDNTLYLGFNGDFAKTKMERDENISLTQKILAQVFEREVPLKCFVASGQRKTLPPEVDSDGMVAAALRDLGGEIVDIQ